METIDRAFLLPHPQYHQKNLRFIVETLLNNDYPIDFVFETINARLRSLCHRVTHKQRRNENSVDESSNVKLNWYDPLCTAYVGKNGKDSPKF